MASIDNSLLDDPLVGDGNTSFIGGQVSATNPDRIPADSYASAVNMDLDELGRLVTRRGAKTTSGSTVTGAWEEISSTWGAISSVFGSSLSSTAIDAGFFFDTGAGEWVLIAQGGAILQGTESSVYASIASSSYTGSNVWFAQLGNRCYYCDANGSLKYIDSAVANQTISAGRVTSIEITNPGIGYTSVPAITFSSGVATATAVLGYGGKVVAATVTAAGSGYSATTPPTISFAAAPAGGTTATGIVKISQVPSKPKFLVTHTNRLFCASADTAIPADTVYVSDILDGESWDLAGNSIRVGGDGDPITGLFSWYGNYLLVFKERSIWLVDANPLQDVADWEIKLVNNRIGCVSHRSIQPVGRDVFFLSKNGVRRLSNIESGTQTEVGQAISTDVQDVIQGINQSALSTICSAYYRNRYFLAIPSGSATTPDTVLVFNAISNKWLGTWTGWRPREFVVTAFSGQVRLAFADNQGKFWTWDDYTSLADETSGEYRDDTTDYASYVVTRAYNHGEPLVDKQGYTVSIQTENQLPDTSVTAYLSYDKDQSGSFTSLDSAISVSNSTKRLKRSYNLLSKGHYEVIQFKFGATRHKVVLHGLAVAAFADALKPQE